MKNRIEAQLQPGATVAEINEFLDSEGIDNTSGPFKTGDFSFSQDFGIPPGTYVAGTIIRGDSCALTIDFVLSDDLRFERVVVRESHLGP